MSPENKFALRRHQLGWVRAGAEGYNEAQTELIKKLRDISPRRIELTTHESVLCDVCPLNPRSEHFLDEGDICVTNDPRLTEMDLEDTEGGIGC